MNIEKIDFRIENIQTLFKIVLDTDNLLPCMGNRASRKID